MQSQLTQYSQSWKQVSIRESLDGRITHIRTHPLPPDSEPNLTLSRSAQKVLAQDWFVPSNCVCQSIIMSYKAGRRGLHDMMWLDPVHQPGFPTAPGKPGTLLSIMPASLVNDLGSVGLWVARGNTDWTYYGHYKVEKCPRVLTVSEFQRLDDDTRKFWIDTIFQCRLFHDRERSIHNTSDVQEAKLRIEMELRRGEICIDVLALRCVTFNPNLTKLLQDTARRKSRRSR
ncbi:hypothetical protein DENSPDRAFT_562339 [Dentipellis sp. KUC8613]|nr:hypothetical protein DENSPDRAFT_562339 [Dentipellis sp. KUC8613]